MTDPRTTVRLALYYRALATGSFLVGGAIAAVGLWLGLGDAVAVLTRTFLQEDVQARVLAAANLPLTVVLVAVGVTVWQVGKATAFYWTFPPGSGGGYRARGLGPGRAGRLVDEQRTVTLGTDATVADFDEVG